EAKIDQAGPPIELILVHHPGMRALDEERIDIGLAQLAAVRDRRSRALVRAVLEPPILDAGLGTLAEPLMGEGDAVVDDADDHGAGHGCPFPESLLASAVGSDSESSGNPIVMRATDSRSLRLRFMNSKKPGLTIAVQ